MQLIVEAACSTLLAHACVLSISTQRSPRHGSAFSNSLEFLPRIYLEPQLFC